MPSRSTLEPTAPEANEYRQIFVRFKRQPFLLSVILNLASHSVTVCLVYHHLQLRLAHLTYRTEPAFREVCSNELEE